MSCFRNTEDLTDRRDLASASDVLGCFHDERNLLLQLAFLITGDSATAEQSVITAREMAIQGPATFHDWLVAWAKWVTINAAIAKTRDAISGCGERYTELRCDDPDNLIQSGGTEEDLDGSFLVCIDPKIIVAELDPLARAVLILRTATRSSISYCALRLTVSSGAVLAARRRAITWLRDLQVWGASGGESDTSTKPSSSKDRWVSGDLKPPLTARLDGDLDPADLLTKNRLRNSELSSFRLNELLGSVEVYRNLAEAGKVNSEHSRTQAGAKTQNPVGKA